VGPDSPFRLPILSWRGFFFLFSSPGQSVGLFSPLRNKEIKVLDKYITWYRIIRFTFLGGAGDPPFSESTYSLSSSTSSSSSSSGSSSSSSSSSSSLLVFKASVGTETSWRFVPLLFCCIGGFTWENNLWEEWVSLLLSAYEKTFCLLLRGLVVCGDRSRQHA